MVDAAVNQAFAPVPTANAIVAPSNRNRVQQVAAIAKQ
jgi:hypothetical protein